MAISRMADQVGRVLGGRYRLVAAIGAGASAHVFLADDVSLRRRVAVKVLHPGLARDDAFLRRFRAEAQSAAALNHSHVMRVFDWGEDDEDGPYLVLEHLDGGSLRDLLDSGARLTPSQALGVGLEAARALDYAHRRGIVHRDIKPANLLFDAEGRTAIADFGLARALAEAAWTEPTGVMLGTARYASPEQAQGLSVDGKADVYSLALVLVEAVTGQVPFTADTTLATLMARVGRDLVAPAALAPLAEAIEAAGKADPSERIDAAAFAAALHRAAAALPAPGPLPLAPPRRGDPTVVMSMDPTELGVATPALYDREADDLEGAPLDLGLGRPRRRWAKRLGLAFVVAAVVAALTVAALAAGGQLRPQHEVPKLVGLQIAEATALATEDKLDVEVTGREFRDNTVPGQVLEQSPLDGDLLREGDSIEVKVSKGPQPVPVPDLTGKPRADATGAVERAGLKPVPVEEFSDTVPVDVVIDWTPKGEQVPRGGEVKIIFSKGPEPKPLPSLVDRLVGEAEKILADLGLAVKKEERFSDTVEKGKVIATAPAAGQPAKRGDTVTVTVSKGPDLVKVPSVRGLSCFEAADAIEAAGLVVGDTDGDPRKGATGTEPEAGTEVKRGSSVKLRCRG